MQKVTSLKSLNDRIRRQNAKFAAATPEQKRVMIAQDTIDRIVLNQLNPDNGAIIRPSGIHGFGKDSIQNLLKRNKGVENCHVCAKGGLLLSIVGRVNQMTVCDITQNTSVEDFSSPIHLKLQEFFDRKQLDLIEQAFEGRRFGWHIIDFCIPALRFYESFRNDKERLLGICENIVANKGIFKV